MVRCSPPLGQGHPPANVCCSCWWILPHARTSVLLPLDRLPLWVGTSTDALPWRGLFVGLGRTLLGDRLSDDRDPHLLLVQVLTAHYSAVCTFAHTQASPGESLYALGHKASPGEGLYALRRKTLPGEGLYALRHKASPGEGLYALRRKASPAEGLYVLRHRPHQVKVCTP